MPVRNPAQNYAEYRPRYPDQLVEDLIERTVAGQGEKLVDWGAGTGELTLRLSPFFNEVVAVDHHPQMVSVGREKAQRLGIENVRWLVSRAEDLELAAESCDLITSASAFHWMDRALLAERALRSLRPDGAVAIAGGGGGGGVHKGDAAWHKVAAMCVEKYLGQAAQGQKRSKESASRPSASTGRRKAGSPVKKASSPAEYSETLTDAGFKVERLDYAVDFSWGVDEVFGYLYSVGFVPLRALGDRRGDFESDLKKAFDQFNPSGIFQQTLHFYLMIASVP